MFAKRRFEFDDGHSSKFWEIDLKANRQTVRYGKLGTAGRIMEKRFSSKEAARAAVAKLIREKLEKGYREVTRAPTKNKPTSRRARATTSGTVRRASNSPLPARLLDEAIYREAGNKGARVNQRRELPRSVKRCPDFIAEFYENIVWPKGKVFDAIIGDNELYSVSFEGPVQEVPHEIVQVIAGCKGKDLFGVGSQEGGNKILLLDGNDKNMSDPTVYEVDHHPEPGDRLEKYCKLSKFLRCLEN